VSTQSWITTATVTKITPQLNCAMGGRIDQHTKLVQFTHGCSKLLYGESFSVCDWLSEEAAPCNMHKQLAEFSACLLDS
jgi:hypothetical protein